MHCSMGLVWQRQLRSGRRGRSRNGIGRCNRQNQRSVHASKVIAVKSEFLDRLARDTQQLRTEGLFKPERVLTSPQQAVIRVGDGGEVINLCANNYLGLANHPACAKRPGWPRPLRLRHGVRPLHLRHAGASTRTSKHDSPLPRHGRRHPLQFLLGRQRRSVRDAPRMSRTPSSATSSTTPASSTASACARRSACATNNDLDELETRLKEASGAASG